MSAKLPHFSRLLPAMALFCSAFHGVFAEGVPNESALVVPLATGEIKIDGHLDEEAWSHALEIPLPVEFSPAENTPAPVRTICLITYDRRAFYVAFRAFDPEPEKIRAHLADRDAAFRNDYVGIVIDSFNDERRGFAFMTNPLGIQMDASSDDSRGGGRIRSASGAPREDFTWDAIWDSAARITSEGYQVEMEIPFNQIRFTRKEGEQTWGLFAFRAWPRDVFHRLGSVPIDRQRDCYFCQVSKIRGMDGISPGRNLEIGPTLTLSRFDENQDFPGGDLARGAGRTEPGLNLRWGVTPNLSLNATLQPDFSQVEADSAQLEINTRFTLFFPEKRPFFLEGKDFFETPIQAVFTRALADPSWASKLTGKEGRNAIGVLIAEDDRTNMILPANQASGFATLEDANGNPVASRSEIARYRRDVGSGSTLGILGAFRSAPGYSNRVGGIDGRLRLTDSDSFSFQALRSRTRYPGDFAARNGEREDFDGTALSLDYQHRARNWRWALTHRALSKGFRADLGFVPRVDLSTNSARIQRVFIGEEGRNFYNELSFEVASSRTEDQAGVITDQSTDFSMRFRGPLQSFLFLRWREGQEYYAGRHFDRSGVRFFFNIRPTGDFTSSLRGEYSNSIDFVEGRAGRVLLIEPGITYNIGKHLYLQLDHTFRRFTLDGKELFEANLSQARVIYHFNSRLLVRAIFQYRDIQRSEQLYFSDRRIDERRTLGQYILSYKINAQTLAFIGYSENRGAPRVLDLDLRDRTFFAKFGYAWLP